MDPLLFVENQCNHFTLGSSYSCGVASGERSSSGSSKMRLRPVRLVNV